MKDVFKGTVEGIGASVSCSGDERSGISVKASGELSGANILGWVSLDGRDIFEVSMTTGRRPKERKKILGYVELEENGDVVWTQYESERIIRAK